MFTLLLNLFNPLTCAPFTSSNSSHNRFSTVCVISLGNTGQKAGILLTVFQATQTVQTSGQLIARRDFNPQSPSSYLMKLNDTPLLVLARLVARHVVCIVDIL